MIVVLVVISFWWYTGDISCDDCGNIRGEGVSGGSDDDVEHYSNEFSGSDCESDNRGIDSVNCGNMMWSLQLTWWWYWCS